MASLTFIGVFSFVRKAYVKERNRTHICSEISPDQISEPLETLHVVPAKIAPIHVDLRGTRKGWEQKGAIQQSTQHSHLMKIQRVILPLIRCIHHQILSRRRRVVHVCILIVEIHFSPAVVLVVTSDDKVVVHHDLFRRDGIPIELVMLEEHMAVRKLVFRKEMETKGWIASHHRDERLLIELLVHQHETHPTS